MPRGYPKSKNRGMYMKKVQEPMAKTNKVVKSRTKTDVRQTSLFERNIQFRMPLVYFWGSLKDQYFQLVKDAFGIERGQINVSPLRDFPQENRKNLHFVHITTSPEKFAYFLIRRQELGLANSFAELNVHYLGDPAPTEVSNRFETD